MGKLKCNCGHVISDVSDNLSYMGEIIPDQAFYKASDKIEEFIDSLIKATKEGKRNEWIEKHFNDQYPKDLTDTQMVYDIFSSKLSDLNRTIYQCENCQRIWIQLSNSNKFVPFIPEDKSNSKDILSLG